MLRRAALAFAACSSISGLLAACGGGGEGVQALSGSTAVLASAGAASAPAPAPAPAPPPPPAPPASAPAPALPAASAPPAIVFFNLTPPVPAAFTPQLTGGSIAVSADGNAWFTAGFTTAQIGRITPAGAVSYPVVADPADGVYGTGPLATGADGNLWFADPVGGNALSGAIGTIDRASGIATKFATPLMRTTSQITRATTQDLACSAASVCTPVPAGTCVVAGSVASCTTATTGPTPVATCAASAGDALNAWLTTRCTTTTQPPMPATTCSVDAAAAGNGFVTTTCTGITPGSQAYAVAAGPNGKLWFTEYTAPRIGRFDPVTHVAVEFGPLRAPANAIAAGPDGNVWFVEDTGPTTAPVIGRISPTGVVTETSNGLVAGEALGALTSGADGGVWFVKASAGGAALGRIDPVSGTIAFHAAGLVGTFPSLAGIALGPDGNVWFTDSFDALLGRAASDGTIAEFGSIAVNAPLNAIASGPALGGVKIVWFTDPRSSRIGRAVLP